MRECLDEGILQSYFDGELSSEQMESVTSHLVSCMNCAAAARELEGEANLLSSALAPEFDATVPTEHLRHRIDVAVAGLQLGNQNAVREPRSYGRWLASISHLSLCVYSSTDIRLCRAGGGAGVRNDSRSHSVATEPVSRNRQARHCS